MKKSKTGIVILLPILFVAGAMLLKSCALHPLAWKPEIKPSFTGSLALNEKLSAVEKISLNGWYGPEDIVFDKEGNLYCGVHSKEYDFSDGRILKIDNSGKVEIFLNTNSWVSGLHFDNKGNLIALSHKLGLISIAPDKKVTVLANKDDKGRPFLIPNGLDIASDGKIYFSNTSYESAYTVKYGRKLILEMRPNGGLYCYDPTKQKVETLIDGTYFGNGVVISKDESHLLMTETEKYRILRYWLKGDKKGTTDVFMHNLPGFPNGISIRDNGSYWLGFSTKRNDALDNIHRKTGMKKFVYALPNFLQPKQELFGMMLNISQDGKVMNALFDSTGKFVPEAGAVKEFKGHLYIGGDVVSFIGRYRLDAAIEVANH
jgi:sugar lactone lactonase YvrE